ncbi:MAG: DedA family protein [Actinomycetota bacterium]
MDKTNNLKKMLLWLAGVRLLLGIAAILLAKFLYEDHFLFLVLMRPTKEVILAGAFLAKKQSDPALLLQIVLAAIPLSILGVWHFYYLGRLYSSEIKKGELPGVAGRLLPTEKIHKLQKVLKKKGPKLVFLGRLAAFPSALVGAAAGSSDMKSRKFLPADGLGALAGIGEVIAAGYVFGTIFNPDDPKTSWIITGFGVAALFALFFLLGKYLSKE